MGDRRGVRGNSAFVVPTDFGSHSMLHQTLISSSSPSFSASASSSSSPFVFASSPFASTAAPSAFLRASAVSGSVVEKEGRMEALRSSLRPEDAAEEMTALPAAWGVVERGGVPGEGFSVEDLLDLEEFCEAEKDGGEGVEAPVVGEDKACDSHESSDVSYELMPPPPTEIGLPAHDAEELEWVSRYMDDSNSELPPPPPPPAAPMASLAAPRPLPPRQPRRPQEGAHRALPTAADPMRTPTICALSTEALVPVKAKRSKRARAAVWSLSGAAHFSDSTSSSSTTTTTSSCSSSASFSPFLLFETSAITASDLLFDDYNHLPPPPKKSKNGKNSRHKPKKRGRKPKQLPPQFAAAAATSPAAPGDRRCSHCGVQKTPQWRAGPEGAKTLCNACGVRYKSGRLLPEYRPACSPTFVSSIHSNSHRKVLEMRRKKEASLISASPPVASF